MTGMTRIRGMWRKMVLAVVLAGILAGVFGGFERATVWAAAKATEYRAPSNTCQSGKYIYYSYNMSGNRMGIHRMHVDTGKIDKLVGYQYKGKPTNGYSSISVKGNWIYCTYDLNYGTDASFPYIYRIRTDGKAKQRLAEGQTPILIGDWVYYVKTARVKEDGMEYSAAVGIYKMKLDGSGKTCIYPFVQNTFVWNLMTDGKNLYFQRNNTYKKLSLTGKSIQNVKVNQKKINVASGSDSKKVIADKVTYSIRGGSLYSQKQGSKTQKKLFAAAKGEIQSFTVSKDGVVVKLYRLEYNKQYGFAHQKAYVYYVKLDGSGKTRLASWWLGE